MKHVINTENYPRYFIVKVKCLTEFHRSVIVEVEVYATLTERKENGLFLYMPEDRRSETL